MEHNTTNEHDKTYENESTRDYSPMVQISVKEYDRLKEQGKYITCLLYTSPSPRD